MYSRLMSEMPNARKDHCHTVSIRCFNQGQPKDVISLGFICKIKQLGTFEHGLLASNALSVQRGATDTNQI